MKAKLRLSTAVLLVAAASAAGASVDPAASAPAADPSGGPGKVLRRAEAAFTGRSPRSGHLTPLLFRLIRAYPSLSPRGQARADRLLARPTDNPDPDGNPYRVPEAGASPACTPNFCVHWVERGADAPPLKDTNGTADGDRVPDWVEVNQLVAERVYAIENSRLRWRAPRSDRRRGGRKGKTDIYLSDVGHDGLFGYAAPDRGQIGGGRGFRRSLFAYLVMDNDFARRQFPGTVPLEDLEVTLAHEYNHVLQFSYDAFQDLWTVESTAVWMEDQVFDDINDYRRYLRRWVRLRRVPLTAPSVKVYGTAVWNFWLQRHYGTDLIRKAWAGATKVKPATFSVGTYDRAIRRAGRSTFNRDFVRFCRDIAEWRTATVFPEGGSYPDIGRRGRLSAGRKIVRVLNHTTYVLLDVPRRGRKVHVRAEAPRGTSAGLALVGRIGSERAGRVISRFDFARSGGALSVGLPRPRRFDRLTAVVVNADTTQTGFDPLALDWRYTDDHQPFELRLSR